MATVPVEITWTTGQVVTAAQLNACLRDAINFLLSKPAAVLRQTVAQSLASGSFTSITWDTEDQDNDGGHSTTSNTSRYTAQTAGWWLLTGVYHAAANNTGRRITRWTVNGNGVTASFSSIMAINFNGGSTGVVAVARRVHLNVGDYVELQGLQDSGGALNTVVSGSENASYMGVQWCST